MPKSVTVAWKLPIKREQGGTLLPNDLQGVEVALAIVGAGYTVLNVVPPTELSLLVPDLESGDWSFRLVVVDTNGARSVEVAVPFSILDDSPPGIVTDVVVTVN